MIKKRVRFPGILYQGDFRTTGMANPMVNFIHRGIFILAYKITGMGGYVKEMCD
jgi:hypothetical protein